MMEENMKNEKFKNLIIDAYKKSKEGNLVGILYSTISTYGFSTITDIEGFTENSPADMLYLKSKLTDTEVDIYEYDFIDYKIKDSESTIYVKLRNKEIPLMF
jgi:hypothetical protein